MSEDEELAQVKARLKHCERALCGAIAQRNHFARGLRSVRDFAQSHHSDEGSHMWLHGLTIDIPHIVETVFGTTSEETRRHCRRHLEDKEQP